MDDLRIAGVLFLLPSIDHKQKWIFANRSNNYINTSVDFYPVFAIMIIGVPIGFHLVPVRH